MAEPGTQDRMRKVSVIRSYPKASFAIALVAATAVGTSALIYYLFSSPATPDIEFLLASDKSEYIVGEAPKISLHVINHRDQAVTLVRDLENSELGFLYPLVGFRIGTIYTPLDLDSNQTCYFPGPVSEATFLTLQPGESREFAAQYVIKLCFDIKWQSGTHKLLYRYATEEGNRDLWIGPVTRYDQNTYKTINSLLDNVPPLDIVSNTLEFTFKDQPEIDSPNPHQAGASR